MRKLVLPAQTSLDGYLAGEADTTYLDVPDRFAIFIKIPCI